MELPRLTGIDHVHPGGCHFSIATEHPAGTNDVWECQGSLTEFRIQTTTGNNIEEQLQEHRTGYSHSLSYFHYEIWVELFL
jgi:hypothetical protein